MTRDLDRDSGLLVAFDWFHFALDNASSGNPIPQPLPQVMPDSRSSSHLTEKLNSWLARAETDTDPKVFIDQFHAIDLPDWDHYTHIRIAYLLLTMYGRREGKFRRLVITRTS